MAQTISRRQFARAAGAGCAAAFGTCAALAQASEKAAGSAAPDAQDAGEALAPLPASSPDPDDIFGVDLNVNMTTIDGYLGRPDVAYRDVRMVFDSADWASMDADPDITHTIEGFQIVPYPYLATLEPLPVEGAYTGDTLYTLTWDNEDDLDIVDATPNYRESQTILEELFPKDTAIFLMCGGAGYAHMTKKLLTFLGWDEDKLYNVGGNWFYQGDHAVTTIERGAAADGSEDTYALWRVDIPTIDFSLLHATQA